MRNSIVKNMSPWSGFGDVHGIDNVTEIWIITLNRSTIVLMCLLTNQNCESRLNCMQNVSNVLLCVS